MEEYTVEEGDTLQRLAIKFNCNPSDIVKENKLSPFQSVLYSGVKITIPKPGEIDSNQTDSCYRVNRRNPVRSHPGIATRLSDVMINERSMSLDLEDNSERQFVKLNASRVLDYVSTPCNGTLLITPKFLVFDPERIHTDDDQTELINTAEPIANVGVSISLDSVVSLNTYCKLSEVINEKQIIFENSPDTVKEDVFEFMDDEDSLYLVLKAVPLSDSYTGPSFSSNTINSLHKDCKLFSFSIPKGRVEEVYSFLISCIGEACNKTSYDVHEVEVTSKNCEEDLAYVREKYLEATTSWEMVDPSQCSVVADALKEFEEVKFKPQYINGESNILTDSMLYDLAANLPVNLNGSNLTLVYKTATHGYSLGTIYRKMKAFSSSTLLLIRDNSNTVFGAFMSDPIHISSHYYGTGETFVFHWKPDFKKYEWTRDNSFFMKGDVSCFAIGAKSGHSAIWFEDTLKFGRSEPTDTFDNPTLCGDCEDTDRNNAEALIRTLSDSKSITVTNNSAAMGYFFVIDCLEVWRFSV